MRILLLVLMLVITGCVTIPKVQMMPGANNVRVAKSDPEEGYELIGPVSGIDGDDCGRFGYRGTYERAFVSLLNKTYEMGGDYAQIISLTEPHSESGCFDNHYVIRAMAYKKIQSPKAN